MEFSRQESWSGLSFPSPGDLPFPGLEPASLMSPALAGVLFTLTPSYCCVYVLYMMYAHKARGEGTTEDEMFGWHHRLDGHGLG